MLFVRCLRKPDARSRPPPKCIFTPPLPADLITVACCNSCNNACKLDDEAFMIFISTHHAASAQGKWIWKNRALESLRRSQKLRANVRKSLISIAQRDGNRIERRTGITIPDSRINPVLIRITKGLLATFHPEIPRNSLQYEASMLNPDQNLVDNTLGLLKYDERGNGAFRFWRGISQDDPNEGVWAFVFFYGMCFSVTHK